MSTREKMLAEIRERRVVLMYFGAGYSVGKIARLTGFTYIYVKNTVDRFRGDPDAVSKILGAQE